MLLMIDNYDSFTYNLVQYFQQLGQEVVVVRNDEITVAQAESMQPDAIVISPGPKSPDQAGISLAIIEQLAGKVPILGVCLGHQTLAQVYGAKVVRAEKVMHGKTSLIEHQSMGVFANLPNPLRVTRYHSLVVEPTSVPDCLMITAHCLSDSDQMQIMGLKHKTMPIEGVQFHPESIMTEQGLALLANFLTDVKIWWQKAI